MRGNTTGVSQTAFLQRINPCIKLLAVLLVALLLSFIFDPITPCVLFALILLTGRYLGKLSFRAQLKPLLIFILAGLAILLANLLFNKGNAGAPALAWLGPLKITQPALWAAASLWLRLMCFALLSLVFVKTTPPQDLILSLAHQLHLNYKVAYGTMVGYRMLPLLQSDYQTIQAAQRVRGVKEGRGPLAACSRFWRCVVPLLVGAVRKAGRVATAMDARAFGALPERTYRRRLKIGRADWAFLAASVAIVAGMVTTLWLLGLTHFTLG